MSVLAQRSVPKSDTAPPSESSHDRIITQSLTLFSALGYHGVSMNEIAHAVGITKAALYYHFEDKEALFVAAVRSKTATLAAELEPIIAADCDIDTLLRNVALFLLDDGLGEYRQLQGDLLTVIRESRRQDCLHDIRKLTEVLVTRLRQEQASRHIADDVDLELSVSLFFSMIGGQIRRFALDSETHPTQHSHAAMADLIVRIWLYGVQSEPIEGSH
jgi:AcrR family transcriptional regulator